MRPGPSRRRRITIVPITLFVLASLWVTASAAEEPWSYAAGTRQSAQSKTGFQVWWRGTEAVVEERQGDALVWQAGCRRTTLVEVNHAARSAVTRSDIAPEQCFKWATASSLAVALAVHDTGMQKVTVEEEKVGVVETYTSVDSSTRVGIVKEWGVPRVVISPDGETTTWDYDELRRTIAEPPSIAVPHEWTTESYSNIALGQASDLSGLGTLPERVGDLAFTTAFEYRATGSATPTLYVFWMAGEKQLQLVRGVGPIASSELGVHEDGGDVVFRKQLGDEYVQIFAPSRRELELLLSGLKMDR